MQLSRGAMPTAMGAQYLWWLVWPCPSPCRAWVSLTEGAWGHPSAIPPEGWSLHPAPGASGRVGGAVCVLLGSSPRGPMGICTSMGSSGVCRGSRP